MHFVQCISKAISQALFMIISTNTPLCLWKSYLIPFSARNPHVAVFQLKKGLGVTPLSAYLLKLFVEILVAL